MNPILFKVLMLVGKLAFAYLRKEYLNLTPAQKAEIAAEVAKPPDEQWWNIAKSAP